jgi:CRISPR-associated protein Csm2
MAFILEEDTRNWINNGPSNDLMGRVEETGKHVKENGLTTSQIRNIFTKVKEIEAKGINKMKADFVMLKPLTAYACKRATKKGLDGFEVMKNKFINPAIDQVLQDADEGVTEKRFHNFVKLFEAILAYHKAAGGI